MANAFKNVTESTIATSLTDVITAAGSAETTVIGMTIANTHTAQVTVDIQLVPASGDTVYIIKDAPIPVGSSLIVVGGEQKVVLEAGDKLKALCSVGSVAHSTISILEIT